MDTNSITSTYMSSMINTDYTSVSSTQSSSDENNEGSMGYDTYEPSATNTQNEMYYTYTSTASISEGAEMSEDIPEPLAEEPDIPEPSTEGTEVSEDTAEALTEGQKRTEAADAEDPSDKKAETKVEVKKINTQIYMTITTTNEDGSISIRRIKLGGNNSNIKPDDNPSKTDDSLADAVTM